MWNVMITATMLLFRSSCQKGWGWSKRIMELLKRWLEIRRAAKHIDEDDGRVDKAILWIERSRGLLFSCQGPVIQQSILSISFHQDITLFFWGLLVWRAGGWQVYFIQSLSSPDGVFDRLDALLTSLRVAMIKKATANVLFLSHKMVILKNMVWILSTLWFKQAAAWTGGNQM